jgi:hypothetical protein
LYRCAGSKESGGLKLPSRQATVDDVSKRGAGKRIGVCEMPIVKADLARPVRVVENKLQAGPTYQSESTLP